VPPDQRRAFEQAIRLAARALNVTQAAVRAALHAIPEARAQEDAALGVLLPQLPQLRLRASHPGRPHTVELVATRDVAFGEGVAVKDRLPGQVVLRKGEHVRAALFRATKRSGRLAQFTVTLPADLSLYRMIFLVLLSERRVWTANIEELVHARDTLAAGQAWHRVRLLAGGALRFEMPGALCDWDLSFRTGSLPPEGS
jgi:hypothetical protein